MFKTTPPLKQLGKQMWIQTEELEPEAGLKTP